MPTQHDVSIIYVKVMYILNVIQTYSVLRSHTQVTVTLIAVYAMSNIIITSYLWRASCIRKMTSYYICNCCVCIARN